MPSPLRETIPTLTETTPAPFPAAGKPLERRGLSRLRLRLRPAAEADLPFLRALYGTTRSSEVAAAGWPPVLAEAFLASQFDLQHRHFVGERLATDFWICIRQLDRTEQVTGPMKVWKVTVPVAGPVTPGGGR